MSTQGLGHTPETHRYQAPDKDLPRLPCGDTGKQALMEAYRDSIMRYGQKNVEVALIFVAQVVDPRTGLATVLQTDDEAVLQILGGAFAASRREELNSESWVEKLSDAVETVRYSFKLPIILLPDGGLRVTELNGDTSFEGSDWDFVRWVRDAETLILTPEELDDVNRGLRG